MNWKSQFFSSLSSWAYEQTFFPSAQKIFPFSNPNPFPFEPKETKIRENNFSEMKEREESFSIFVVGERIYNVKFNMNAQTWLLNHYWLFLLEYFFLSQGSLGPKGCVGRTLMLHSSKEMLNSIILSPNSQHHPMYRYKIYSFF